jgi:hypothetical protein
MSAPPAKPPISDSPLFWMFLFGLVALVAVTVVGPRYARRQGQLQQKYEAREQIARQAAEPGGPATGQEVAPVQPVTPPTLRPLSLALAGFLAIIAAALLVQRLRP